MPIPGKKRACSTEAPHQGKKRGTIPPTTEKGRSGDLFPLKKRFAGERRDQKKKKKEANREMLPEKKKDTYKPSSVWRKGKSARVVGEWCRGGVRCGVIIPRRRRTWHA